MTTFDAWVLPTGFPEVASTAEVVLDGPGVDGEAEIRVRFPELSGRDVGSLAGLLRERRSALLDRSTSEIIAAIDGVARRFLTPGDPLRRMALTALPVTAGMSPEMAEAVLDGMAADWTTERLNELIVAEFGGPAPLDGLAPLPGDRRGRALGFPLSVHIGAGTVPGVAVTSMVRALLVRSSVLIKPGLGDVVLPVLFARALADEAPWLAACVATLYWPGGTEGIEDAVLREADIVVAYGGDEALGHLRANTPIQARFIPYHHRLSLGLVLAGASGELGLTDEIARAVAIFDQYGCVSPRALFVESESEDEVRALAVALGEAFERVSAELPQGRLTSAEASRLHQVRGTAELRGAAGEGVCVLTGGAGPWTVVFDPTAALADDPPQRFLRVMPIANLDRLGEVLRPLASRMQTMAVAGMEGREVEVSACLARVGVTRVTGFDRAPWPPPWWHHDGLGPLRVLVRWMDLEE